MTEPEWLKSNKLEDSEPEWIVQQRKNGPFNSSLKNHDNNPFSHEIDMSSSSDSAIGRTRRGGSFYQASLSGDHFELPQYLESLLEDADEDDHFAFFRPLLKFEQSEREEITKQLIKVLKKSKPDFLQSQLPQIHLLAYYSPFKDISDSFRKFLDDLKQIGISVPKQTKPSRFIPEEYFQKIPEISEPILQEIFSDLWLETGRISHLFQTIALHPSYFEKFLSQYNFIMVDSSSPLPLHWRNYLAILSANRQKCKILVDQQENEFLLNGGDPSWLNGVGFIIPKLKKILDVIEIISHQPWLLRSHHIKDILKGSDNWLISELLHALIIICTFKQLASLIFGLGVLPDPDYEDFVEEDFSDFDNLKKSDDFKNEQVLKLLKSPDFNRNILDSQKRLSDPFITAETDDEIFDQKPKFYKITDYPRYTGNWVMRHKDFDVRSKQYTIFRIQDYCWADEGFELMRQYLPGAGVLLNEAAQHIYNLTYRTLANENNVNTEPIRRAIWQYIQRVKGMRHDDYDYGEVNTFLTARLKSFIKKLTCFPETILFSDFEKMEMELTPVEKVHVALLATESSKQAELLYGLYALEQFQNSMLEED